MKNKIFSFNKAAKVIALSICLVTAGSAYAQPTLVTPTIAPTLFDTYPQIELGLNTAYISAPAISGCVLLYTSYDAVTGGYFNAFDYCNSTANMGVTGLGGTPTGSPDIIIGNTISATTIDTQFIVAVAYPTSSTVRVDFFLVDDNGTTVTMNTRLNSVTYSAAPTTVHIDIIAASSNTSPTGRAFCDSFVLTWDDAGTGKVYAAYGTLGAAQAGTFTISATTIGTGIAPDVAAIQKTVSGSTHKVALITYTDATNAHLYLNSWDINASTVSLTTTLDAMTGSNTVSIPRIDANDNLNLNGPINSYYKVVAQVDSASYNVVRTYDNLTNGTLSPFWTSSDYINLHSSGVSSPLYQNYAPCVAFGGKEYSVMHPYDGTQFIVQHYTEATVTSTSSTVDIVMMEPIDYSAPYRMAYNAVGLQYDYYWVSNYTSTFVSTSGNYANSVSTACNSVSENTFDAWVYPDATAGYTDILFKVSPYVYAYKQVEPVTSAVAQPWQVYPNPASDYVTVNNPAATGIAAGYMVVDITGRTLLQGSLDPGTNEIDLGNLAAGDYILQLHRADGAGTNQMFVKQ